MVVPIFIVCALLGACKARDSEAHGRRASEERVDQVQESLAAIVATCADAQSPVDVRRKGQPQWDPIAIGSVFRERDWVRTGKGGFARIRFGERGYYDLRELTTVLVDDSLSLEAGTLVGVAVAGATPLAIRAGDGSEATIAAVAGGEAAEFRLTRSANRGLEIAVTRGKATVATRDGQREVAAGQATDVLGERSGALRSLLAFPKSVAPGVDARFAFVANQEITLAWKPVPGAAHYQVQVARDTEFRSLVVDREVDGTSTSFTPAMTGMYAWRVAARDATGTLGEQGFARRMFIEDTTPRDFLVAPLDGARLGFADAPPRILFTWQSAGNTSEYRLVITRADAKNEVVKSVTTSLQQVDVHDLREGAYRWRVYALRSDREAPLFLAPRELTIRKQRVKADTEALWK
jgi:hypothetical protein